MKRQCKDRKESLFWWERVGGCCFQGAGVAWTTGRVTGTQGRSTMLNSKMEHQKGAPGFEPGTSWSAVKCSTPELYPLVLYDTLNSHLYAAVAKSGPCQTPQPRHGLQHPLSFQTGPPALKSNRSSSSGWWEDWFGHSLQPTPGSGEVEALWPGSAEVEALSG